MRIYSMTATFGKLEHETLTMEPGLNIIEAPNEWGKSTWSAFLLAMLYGLDTRAKTSKTALADKERFAPWSGAPMSGRMDINWHGKDITIERRTKRRIPLGDFRAYETKTGLSVPELTAANCGQMLLGVEQSVFRRAGFIRHSDLPVTQDEALRRRLNALVTTGDESDAGDRLEQQLKDLRNRCRYNRSGLLPQAEEKLEETSAKLQELDNLNLQCRKLRQRLDELKSWRAQLENHRKALNYAASQEDAFRVAQARDARDLGLLELTRLEHAAADLPSEQTARREADKLRRHLAAWKDLQLELQMLSAPPEMPEAHPPFRGLTGQEARRQAEEDAARYRACISLSPLLPWLIAALLSLGAAAALYLLVAPVWSLIGAGGFVLALTMTVLELSRSRSRKARFVSFYGSHDPEQWCRDAEAHAAAFEHYEAALAAHRSTRADLDERTRILHSQGRELGRGETPEKALFLWEQAISRHEQYQNALREQKQLETHLQTVQSMARTASAPAAADALTCTEEQTLTLLSEAAAEQQRLQQRLGQYQGRMESLGDPAALKKQQSALKERIARLEDRYAALTIALDTLREARQELQRRFAPRISGRARQMLERMTAGRYDRLTLGSDFSLQAGATKEDTLHDAWWRSDGTVDQLYLALRLAVAEELTPHAPLILDDALVRFDDSRLKSALEILAEEAKNRQVILFTCQSRENRLAVQES